MNPATPGALTEDREVVRRVEIPFGNRFGTVCAALCGAHWLRRHGSMGPSLFSKDAQAPQKRRRRKKDCNGTVASLVPTDAAYIPRRLLSTLIFLIITPLDKEGIML